MLTLITKSALDWMERHRRRALARSLLAKSDRELDDIGVTRAELTDALGLPGDVDPFGEARKRSREILQMEGRV